jgi:hypothetical protein
VYVYRCLYLVNPPSMDQIAARIHELSGWVLPEDAKPSEIWLYQPGPGLRAENYEGTCADRSQPKTIEMFERWGLEDIGPDKDPISKQAVRGRVKDGIAMVETLISGRTRFEAKPVDEAAELHARLGRPPLRPKRKLAMTASERKILREERQELDREYEPIDDDEPMGSL